MKKSTVESKKETVSSAAIAQEKPRSVAVPDALTVKQLSELLGIGAAEVIKKLMANGIMASMNQMIDHDTAAIIVSDLGYEVREVEKPAEAAKKAPAEKMLAHRPPVVTVMGHVDHGKTSLLDAIRKSNVAAREKGGITQHIGAYQIETDSKKITFLDTPGHEAFTAMRARGVQVTDIAVIVVAADDGVMPQTIEAINHARAANIPIIIALNKIDKPDANPEKVKKQLAEIGLLIEEWGGDIVCVPVSAKKEIGIRELLENILLVAEIGELKAIPEGQASGAVIEAKLDKSRGVIATMLVQHGVLNIGDILVAGEASGKVKAMFNEFGKKLRNIGPAMPAGILGLSSLPQAGDTFQVVADERQARAMVARKEAEKKASAVVVPKAISLDDLFARVSEGKLKELNVVLKTDVQGSIEPIKDSLEKLSTDQIKVKVIHSGAGSITESDINLAYVSRGIVIGFNSRLEPGAKKSAEVLGVDVRNYDIIYNLAEDIRLALKGMLEPTFVEIIEGRCEIIATFPASKIGRVAGIRISQGKASRDARVRCLRQGKKIADSEVISLKRFKEDVKECGLGLECGVGIKDFLDFQIGDILEFYRVQRSTQA